ncbi:MAG: Ig-like domain-containing protein [Lachnospiraceae bacterium]|nr:Ig-like domain-containing protein [Lachnospiraceae bacterium]
MKKLEKIMIVGVMMILMAVSIMGCKAGEPDSEENTDTETEQQEDQDDQNGQNGEQEDAQEKDTIQLTVYEESFHTAFSLTVGESKKLKISTNYDGSLEYKSADEAIATVDSEGNVTAMGAGRVALTITAGDVTRGVNVVVEDSVVDGQQEEEKTDSTDTAGNTEKPATPAVEQNPTAEQTEGSTKTNISISTVITNADGESVTVVPFEHDIEIDSSNQQEYHIEWQCILD